MVVDTDYFSFSIPVPHPHSTATSSIILTFHFHPQTLPFTLLGLDSGRGGAELWTVGEVDREQHRQLNVAVTVSDAQGLAATQHITIMVDDVNDNPMKPAAKAVYLWKTQVK